MPNEVNWRNPYEDRTGSWYKGNLHTHCSDSPGPCGDDTAAEIAETYLEKGHGFLALSDHMCLTEFSHERLAIIPGIEWNAPSGQHTGIYCLDGEVIKPAVDIDNLDTLLEEFGGRDEVLLILNHPNWQLVPHYRREDLESRTGYDGIEIYNGLIELLPGLPDSTDKWDYLASKGKPVLGYANDDAHGANSLGLAANVVRAAEPTPEAVFHALKTGNFYCTTGVPIADIRREGDTVTVTAPDAARIRAKGNGRIIKDTEAAELSIDLSAHGGKYVRFEAKGGKGSTAWTQMFKA